MPAIGDRVFVDGQQGTLRFIGRTGFKPGLWAGIELDTADGKNDGSVQNVRYFQCPPNHGLFVHAAKIGLADTAAPAATGSLRKPSVVSRTSPTTSPTTSRGNLAALTSSRSRDSLSKLPQPSSTPGRTAVARSKSKEGLSGIPTPSGIRSRSRDSITTTTSSLVNPKSPAQTSPSMVAPRSRSRDTLSGMPPSPSVLGRSPSLTLSPRIIGNDDVRRELESMRMQIDDRQNRIQALQAHIKDLETLLQEAQTISEMMMAKASEAETAQLSLRDRDRMLASVKAELAAKTEELRALRDAQDRSFKSSNGGGEHSRGLEDSRLAELEAELKQKASVVGVLEAKIQTMEAEFAFMRTESLSAESALAKSQAENQVLSKTFIEHQEAKSEFEAALVSRQTEVNQLQQQLTKLQDALQSANEHDQKEIGKLRSKVASVESENATLRQERAERNGVSNADQQELVALRDKLTASEDAKTQLAELHAITVDESNKLKAKIQERDVLVQQLQQALKILQDQHRLALGDVASLKDTLQNHQSSKAAVMNEEQQRDKERIKELESELTAVKLSHDRSVATLEQSWSEQVSALNKKHDQQLASLRQQLDAERQEQSNAAQSADKHSDLLESPKSDLKEKEGELAGLRKQSAESNGIKVRVTDLEAKLAHQKRQAMDSADALASLNRDYAALKQKYDDLAAKQTTTKVSKPVIVCFVCDQEGHTTDECPQTQTLWCDNCEVYGHATAQCQHAEETF